MHLPPHYLALSAMMFMEYAVWGAWMPVLAVRLLGPLKMSGKQTGWIYATLPLASMFSPLLFGQAADKWVDTGWILFGCHLIGAGLLFLAAKLERFWPLFLTMLAYSIFYAATIPLVNALMFRHVSDAHGQGQIFIWAPVAWWLVGSLLTGIRQLFRTGADGRDCLYLGAVLSLVMAVVCLLQPAAPPVPHQGEPLTQALAMLQHFDYAVFIAVTLAVAGMMQFYFLATSRFMQDVGIDRKNVPASMAFAQAVQALATLLLLGVCLAHLGVKWTLTVGAGSWFLLYVIYFIGRPRLLIVLGQGFHGLAYVLFIIVGQIFVNQVAPSEIGNSAQSLLALATNGVGLFLGTQLAGITMENAETGGTFRWRKVWIVPLAILLAGVLVLALVFQGK
jgi:MFS family permease